MVIRLVGLESIEQIKVATQAAHRAKNVLMMAYSRPVNIKIYKIKIDDKKLIYQDRMLVPS